MINANNPHNDFKRKNQMASDLFYSDNLEAKYDDL
jgi:hypothetical protein